MNHYVKINVIMSCVINLKNDETILAMRDSITIGKMVYTAYTFHNLQYLCLYINISTKLIWRPQMFKFIRVSNLKCVEIGHLLPLKIKMLGNLAEPN
jgi:hypothetical protein